LDRHQHKPEFDMSPHTLPAARPQDYERIRSVFPALAGDTVLLENAGGSQVPSMVADRIRTYMLESYAQLGAAYPMSDAATKTVDDAHSFVSTLMNAEDGHVILGPSSSALCAMLGHAYADVLRADQSIVIAENGHEANVGPWVRLAKRLGMEVRWWKIDPETFETPIEALRPLLDDSVAIVAFPHVSNLLGDIADVESITRLAHIVGARVVVDGVAYAPHRAMDVKRWGVDWYVYSTYKVYGPHMGALYGSNGATREIIGPNHFFVADDDVPYKFELGGASHEGCAGILGLSDYVAHLIEEAPTTHAHIERAFELMTACELPLQRALIEFLLDTPNVRLIGSSEVGVNRVPTVSFVHDGISSSTISREVNASGFGIRHGHMYAHRLCEALGIDLEEGVVRVSAVHYNLPREIGSLLECLSGVFRRHG
jgi:cysteine desulfurase family protein (TIGR01976 family)